MSSALVCVSGGVDSAVSLLRCRKKFQHTRAVYVDTRGSGPPPEAVACCSELCVELLVIPASEQFRLRVSEPSLEMFQAGLTPNPCAMCNSLVKLAIPFALLEPGEKLVTGHYARYRDGVLSRGFDRKKDQSYFLSLVPPGILERCFFPLGESHKSDVLQEAVLSKLPFLKRESQDLCFTLQDRGTPGDILDTRGNRVGAHQGLAGYTPGQRKKVGAHGKRMYVVELNRVSNTVVIGGTDSLYSGECFLHSINWLTDPPDSKFECDIQIRYRKPGVPAAVTPAEGCARVVFKEPQKAVSPGQAGVLYLNDTVLCGGIISVSREENQCPAE